MRFVTPAAVLLSAAMLALVVWCGSARIAASLDRLAAQGPAPLSGLPASTNPAPSSVPVTDPALIARDTQLRREQQAATALAEQAPEYIKRCLPDPTAGTRGDHGLFTVTLSVNENGLETRRVFGPRPPTAPKLGPCVEQQRLPPIHIDPPGEAIEVTTQVGIP